MTKLSTAQIAQIAYTACNEAVVILGGVRSPDWKHVEGDEQSQMLAHINSIVATEDTPVPMPAKATPSNGLKDVCTDICIALTKALI
jgi:hypothetical protein